MLAVIVLALAARLAMVAAAPHYEAQGDAADYHLHAVSIATGHGYPSTTIAAPGTPSSLRPPAYPYALAAVYATTGNSLTAGRLLGVGLGVLSVVLVLVVAGEIWGRRVGLTAAGLCAVFPPLVVVSGTLLSESLFIPIELGAIATVLRARASPHPLAWSATAGLLCGLATLTRSVGILLLVAVILGLWRAAPRPGARSLTPPVIAVAAAVLVIVPWTVRNAAEFGDVVPVSTQFGFTLAGAYNSVALQDGPLQGAWQVPCLVPDYAERCHSPDIDEAELDRALRHDAIAFVGRHPRYVLELLRLNTLRFLNLGGDPAFTQLWDQEMGMPNSLRTLTAASVLAAVGLALAGALALAAPSSATRGPLFLWLVPVLMTAGVLPMLGNPRYRTAVDPFLLMLAAVAIVGAIRVARRAQVTRVGAFTA